MPRRRNAPYPRRHRRRRRRGGLAALARPLSVLLAAVAIVAALTMFFKVEQVEVTGNLRYTTDQVVAAAGVEPGDNLILFDKYRMSQQIYTQLPYITAVRIGRRLPSTLLVEVTETQSVAALQSGGEWWLVGASAGQDGTELKVLESAGGELPQGILAVVGLEAVDPVPGRRLELAEGGGVGLDRLSALLMAVARHDSLPPISQADFSGSQILALTCDGRFRVEMFVDADYSYKLDCLAQVIAQLEPNERGTIRMTMSDDSEVRFIPAEG